MPRRPKSYAQLTSDVAAAEARLKSLKELQAQARKQEQMKLAEKLGKIVLKAYPDVDFLSLSDDEILRVLKGDVVNQAPISSESSVVNDSSVTSETMFVKSDVTEEGSVMDGTV